MRKFLLAAGLIMLCADTAFACSIPGFLYQRTTRATMTAQSGKPCEIYFRSSGPMPHLQIIKRPAHGSVSIGSANKVIYQSRAGYSGIDSFTYVHSGRNARNVPGKAVITVAVTVTP
jgi:hypothetical protein